VTKKRTNARLTPPRCPQSTLAPGTRPERSATRVSPGPPTSPSSSKRAGERLARSAPGRGANARVVSVKRARRARSPFRHPCLPPCTLPTSGATRGVRTGPLRTRHSSRPPARPGHERRPRRDTALRRASRRRRQSSSATSEISRSQPRPAMVPTNQASHHIRTSSIPNCGHVTPAPVPYPRERPPHRRRPCPDHANGAAPTRQHPTNLVPAAGLSKWESCAAREAPLGAPHPPGVKRPRTVGRPVLNSLPGRPPGPAAMRPCSAARA
jgi:hypothetical protein